jgi:ubiquinone/menaquinone biosynthesis C-methylase UbiE
MAFLNPVQSVRELPLTEGSVVADFGSGSGHFARALADVVGDTGIVYLIDINPNLMPHVGRAGSTTARNMRFVVGDLTVPGASRIAEGSIDAVVIANLLFQVDDPGAVMGEAVRILRPGGVVLAIDWTDSWGGAGPEPSKIVTAARARKMFEAVGMRYVKEYMPGDHHWGMILEKPRSTT